MRTLFALVLAGTLLVSGCGTETDDATAPDPQPSSSTPSSSDPSASDQADLTVDGKDPVVNLDNARSLWESNGPDDYRWTVERICYCPPQKVSITVADGQGTSPKQAAGHGSEKIVVMEDLFDLVAQEIKQADKVTVTYDPETGAVRKFEADRIRAAADDEIGYVVRKLEPAG